MHCKVVFMLALMLAATCLVEGDLLRPTCACARIYQPVCSSHGVTYNNMCEFECTAKFLREKLGKNAIFARSGRCDGSY